MEEACQASAGAMAALIGAEENVVRGLAAETDVDIANLNCPGQIVISGEAERITLAVSMAKQHRHPQGRHAQRRGRVPFAADGPGVRQTRRGTDAHRPADAAVPGRLKHRRADPAGDFDEIRRTLTEQVTGTVCWTQSVEYMIDTLGCKLFLELGPDDKLAGMVNRIRKGTEVISVSDPASLAKAVERIKRA